jgi:dTDP-4-dehydrorhamnose reductase
MVETTIEPMRIVVTGSAGQLGKSIQDTFEDSSHELVFLDRSALDVTDFKETYQVISSNKPDWIINCAAWTNVDQAEVKRAECSAVNTKGVENIVIAASEVESKLIQISTDYVFDGRKTAPWQESDTQNPISHYGSSKAAAESLICSQYFSESTIIRTSWLYSKYGKNFVKAMLQIGLSGDDDFNVVSDQIGQPTSCIDLSHFIMDVIQLNISGMILHGTNSGSASWYEFAKVIFELTGFEEARVKPVSSENYLQKAERPKNSVLGHGNLEEFGLKPMRSWELALKSDVQEILNAVVSGG